MHTTLRKRNKGFSLPELLVALVVFMLLSTSLVCAVSLGLRYWMGVIDRVNTQQSTQTACNAIASELKQAIVDPDPGTNGNPATGYMSVVPAIAASGILYPNANTVSTNYVDFTEPNPLLYDPSSAFFSATNPSNYRRVKYYLLNNTIYRNVKTYTSSGIEASNSTAPLVQSTTGVLTLTAVYSSPTSLRLIIFSREGNASRTLSTNIYLPLH
jgi:prepilin-type N-terminal cleavage/methylation domain-containing protein